MKAYLITTGSIFGLMAALHVWRAIDERQAWMTDREQFLGMIALGGVAAGLSVWAFRLLRRTSR